MQKNRVRFKYIGHYYVIILRTSLDSRVEVTRLARQNYLTTIRQAMREEYLKRFYPLLSVYRSSCRYGNTYKLQQRECTGIETAGRKLQVACASYYYASAAVPWFSFFCKRRLTSDHRPPLRTYSL